MWSVSLLLAVSLAADPRPDAGTSDEEAQRALESIRAAHLEVRGFLLEAREARETGWVTCVADRLLPLARLRHHAEAVRAERQPLSGAHWREAVARAVRLRDEAGGCDLFVERRVVECPVEPSPRVDVTDWRPPPLFADRPLAATTWGRGASAH